MKTRRTVRQQMEDAYDYRYKVIGTPSTCYYCGWAATCLDHCPALSWVDSYGPGYFEDFGIDFVKVPSCASCNGALGARKLFYPDERKRFLRQYYESKYQALVDAPTWTGAQVNELRGSLKRKISRAVEAKAILEERLKKLGVQ